MVIGVGAAEIVMGALEPGATSVSGSVPAVEDGEHPEATRTMAARLANLIAEASPSRRTGSPYMSVQNLTALARVPAQYAPIQPQPPSTQQRAADLPAVVV